MFSLLFSVYYDTHTWFVKIWLLAKGRIRFIYFIYFHLLLHLTLSFFCFYSLPKLRVICFNQISFSFFRVFLFFNLKLRLKVLLKFLTSKKESFIIVVVFSSKQTFNTVIRWIRKRTYCFCFFNQDFVLLLLMLFLLLFFLLLYVSHQNTVGINDFFLCYWHKDKNKKILQKKENLKFLSCCLLL